ncbi:hypothetical protein D7Y13_42555, partial [Corallococcus praedator]
MRDPARLPRLAAMLLAATPALADAPPEIAAWLALRDEALVGTVGTAPAAATPRLPLSEPAGPPAAPQVVSSDIRPALAQMALAVGARGQAEIAAAQPPGGPGAIYLLTGSTSLAG